MEISIKKVVERDTGRKRKEHIHEKLKEGRRFQEHCSEHQIQPIIEAIKDKVIKDGEAGLRVGMN